MDTGTSHHYRPPFGKQQSAPSAPSAPDPLSFRTARDQLEIDEAKQRTNNAVVKKSLGMHASNK